MWEIQKANPRAVVSLACNDDNEYVTVAVWGRNGEKPQIVIPSQYQLAYVEEDEEIGRCVFFLRDESK
jgi:hypothetical protein